MKQIDIIKTWSTKRCLVVDDIADVRASIKRWLVDFGGRDVDTAGNAEEAIDLCQHHHYDVILADYNLGAGKNGQQFLEEVRFHKLVSNTALFIMITAEADTHYVLHAIEYQPDDYLNKPLNRNALRKRLESAMLKNEALRPIKKALDDNNLERAIEAAGKTLARVDERYHSEIRRSLADLYCQNKDWDKALEIYSSHKGDTPPLWKQIGSARANIGKENFEQAEIELSNIIQHTPLCVEARDLQAELFHLRNDQLRRQETLAQAVKISPRSSQRQRALGDASSATGDHGQAIQAWRAALRHSRNTCQEQADDYLHLANSLNELANESRGSKIAELTKEAMETLNKVEKKYPRNKVIQLRSKQLRAEVFDVQGKPDDYSRELQEAIEVHHNLDYEALRTTSVQLCIDSARSFMNHGFYEEGEKLLGELAELTDDHELSVQIDKLRREPQTHEGMAYAAKLNKVGIEFYELREIYQAQEAFEKVLNELPNHTGLNLNLIQVLAARQVKEELDEKEKHLLIQCLRRVKHITPRSPHYKRFQYLREKCGDLMEEDTTSQSNLTGAAG